MIYLTVELVQRTYNEHSILTIRETPNKHKAWMFFKTELQTAEMILLSVPSVNRYPGVGVRFELAISSSGSQYRFLRQVGNDSIKNQPSKL